MLYFFSFFWGKRMVFINAGILELTPHQQVILCLSHKTFLSLVFAWRCSKLQKVHWLNYFCAWLVTNIIILIRFLSAYVTLLLHAAKCETMYGQWDKYIYIYSLASYGSQKKLSLPITPKTWQGIGEQI